MKKIYILLFILLINQLHADWVKTNYPSTGYAFSFYANENYMLVGSLSTGIYLSTDKGVTWQNSTNGVSTAQIWSVKIIDNVFYAGSTSGKLFKSTDFGVTWVLSNSGIASTTIIRDFAKFEGALYIATNNAGIYKSTDNGQSWTQHNSGIIGLVASTLYASDSDLYCGVLQRVYEYKSSSSSWEAKSTGLPNNTVAAIQESNINNTKYLFAGISSSVSEFALSSDKGNSWVVADNGLPNTPVSTVAVVGDKIFVGNDYGVYKSDDLGTNWSSFNQGLLIASYGLFLNQDSQNLYVLYQGSIWKRDKSEIITEVEETSSTINSFTLSQNYPNPFNPSTTISFSIPQNEFVRLKIYDILGNEVAVLFNQHLSAGTHTKVWNADGLASGVYIYRLEAGNFNQSKKLTLTK